MDIIMLQEARILEGISKIQGRLATSEDGHICYEGGPSIHKSVATIVGPRFASMISHQQCMKYGTAVWPRHCRQQICVLSFHLPHGEKSEEEYGAALDELAGCG
eukprot:5403910-Amphidinium_carterae.1